MKKKRGASAYSDEFRREAVRLVEAGTTPLKQIARELDVAEESLRSRCQRARAQRPGADPVEPTTVLSVAEENQRLKRENARLLEERDILKKAMAFFAKDAR